MALTKSSLLHSWTARNESLPYVGGKPVHTRNSVAAWVDGRGTIQPAPVNTPRFEWASVAGEIRKVMRLERAGTNIALQSENFGTTWSTSGTGCSRAAAAHVASGVSLDLLADTDASQNFWYQNIVFTGNAAKAFSVFVRQGSSTSFLMRFVDQTAGQYRCFAIITWSAAGLPVVTMNTAGTYLGYVADVDGVFRLLFQTSVVTAANTNQIQVWPAADVALTAGNTGSVYVGGVQFENDLTPSSYVKTTTAAATRSADSLYWDYTPAPQAMMAYWRFIERGTMAIGQRVFTLSGPGDAAPYFIAYGSSFTNYALLHNNGSVQVSSVVGGTPVYGDVVELVALLTSAGAVRLIQSINAAAVSDSGASANNTLGAAWGGLKLFPNSGDGASYGHSDFAEVKIVKYADVVAVTAQGIMDELRAFDINSAGEVL